MTDQPPQEPPRTSVSFFGEAGDALVTLARGIAQQPAVASLFGALVVLLIVVYALASDERRTSHMELQLMLDRCLPNVIHGQTTQ